MNLNQKLAYSKDHLEQKKSHRIPSIFTRANIREPSTYQSSEYRWVLFPTSLMFTDRFAWSLPCLGHAWTQKEENHLQIYLKLK